MRCGGEWAEIFAERRSIQTIRLDGGSVAEIRSDRDAGAGIRVIAGGRAGFAYTNVLTRTALLEAAQAAAAATLTAKSAASDIARVDLRTRETPTVQRAARDAARANAAETVQLLRRVDSAARGRGAAVKDVSVTHVAVAQDVIVANTDGLLAPDSRVRTRVTCKVTARHDGRVETGFSGPGAGTGMELYDEGLPESVGTQAAGRALRALEGIDPPGGVLPVVLGSSGGGLLFHEACGHGLEGDGLSRGSSVFANSRGVQVASGLVTAYDDPSLDVAYGSYGSDDEGTATAPTVLVDAGRQVGFLADNATAKLLGGPITGNGRRESYAHPPLPRMSNTYIAAGSASGGAIIGDVSRGVYVMTLKGGDVNTATGEFAFAASEAYLIERGQVTQPLSGLTLLGKRPGGAGVDRGGGRRLVVHAGTLRQGRTVDSGVLRQPHPAGHRPHRVGAAVVSELPGLVASVLDHTIGEEKIEAYAVHRISTTVQAGEDSVIRHVGRAETRGLGVRVIRDRRLGYASTADLDRAAIAATVAAARANAAASDPDEAQELPEPRPTDALEGLLHPEFAQTPLTDKITLLQDLARLVVSLDRHVTGMDTAEYHDEQRTVAVASTRGVYVVHVAGFVEMWADTLGEADDARAGDGGYQFGRAASELDPESLARDAIDRTVRLLGPLVTARPGMAVLLDPDVVGNLLSAIGKGLSGGPVSSGRTPFAGKLGTTVASDCVTLTDDGRSLTSPAAASYDDEGLACRRTQLIERGVLMGALHSTVTARAVESAAGSTGNARRASHKAVPRAAPRCLTLEPSVSRARLLDGLNEAVYIQQLSGSGAGINPVTGRIDVGAVGWLLRDGQPVGRLDTIPIATNLLHFLASVLRVGDDTYPVAFSSATGSTVLCGSRLIDSGR